MPARILLVDDERGFVDTMAKRLENRGYTVGVAYDGPQALAALDGDVWYDVVVLDVKMPGMDGNEVLKIVKADHPLVEVIMLTGHATVESAIEGMKSGAFDYMMKPCNLEDLVSKVEDAYDKKQAHENKILEARARHIVLRRGD
ncbi:MAG: response regulator [Pseudodesulfovibrio sp.]|jgi:DNA-binding NtrC family response regulator|uniref:Response regulator receiver domain-containing protein n=1 Tax=Pseudodesulfovibrio indicus TaxID=1716143 RepID=A0A126QSD6_9BACT|nr:response regulator [Pseudodesulfovibrio indicus]AMK12636.1 two-component system response regulator [Pseudodesulfovibrio indicus]TDT90948.1 response regulator receiver domain-containing protein [Pseudodesulfovibrio indicus]